MKKVHISLFKKGEQVLSVVGLLDTEQKVLLVPKTSKKGTNYIDVVKYDEIHGDIVSEYGYTEDDRQYVNNYYVHELVEKAD